MQDKNKNAVIVENAQKIAKNPGNKVVTQELLVGIRQPNSKSEETK